MVYSSSYYIIDVIDDLKRTDLKGELNSYLHLFLFLQNKLHYRLKLV